ncbi:hypothetical protein ACLB2K_003497 [Fragaria x ananassa]
MQKPESSGRLVKWVIELGEFDIHYRPRTVIKGQAAADFISELTPMKVMEETDPELIPMKVVGESSEVSLEETDPEASTKTSNNAAEYEALIGGLQLARDIDVDRVEVFSDSQLVVNQVN